MESSQNKLPLIKNEELFNKAYGALGEVKKLNDRQHSWLTNAGIGLLGFFIALLVQLKIEYCTIPYIYIVIPIITFLCLVIILGLTYKFIYEKKNMDSYTLDMLINLKDIFEINKKDNPALSPYYTRLIKKIDQDVHEIDDNPYEHKSVFVKGYVIWQRWFITPAIVLMVFYYGLYLFCYSA